MLILTLDWTPAVVAASGCWPCPSACESLQGRQKKRIRLDLPTTSAASTPAQGNGVRTIVLLQRILLHYILVVLPASLTTAARHTYYYLLLLHPRNTTPLPEASIYPSIYPSVHPIQPRRPSRRLAADPTDIVSIYRVLELRCLCRRRQHPIRPPRLGLIPTLIRNILDQPSRVDLDLDLEPQHSLITTTACTHKR